MLVIKKELNEFDFIEEFKGLNNTSFADEYQALGVIYGSLCDCYGDGVDGGLISDYIRFQVEEMDANYFIEQYGYLLDLDDEVDEDDEDDEDEKHRAIEDCLYHHTFYIGNYEVDGVIYYLFDEF